MTEVDIKYNPYRLSTTIKINGALVAENSSLAQKTANRRLQSWIGELPKMLKDERGSRYFDVVFHGNALDYDDVKDSFEQAKRAGVVGECHVRLEGAHNDDYVYNKLLSAYNDVIKNDDCLSDADKAGLRKAIEKINENIFPIHVIATMSSGKSTLINALLGRKLMPSKNEACTAVITEILDDKSGNYSAIVYDRRDDRIKTIDQVTYELMKDLNDDDNVARVSIRGNIPFVDSSETPLRLVDTPGPNNAHNDKHRETMYENINSAAENMILYVLNYTQVLNYKQLDVDDDNNLLNYVAEEIKKGGRETRDRFLFVLNKMDQVNKDDSVEGAVKATRNYLSKHGIEDPQIFPCSAFTALGLRTLLKDIDPFNYDEVEDAVEKYNNDDIRYIATLVQKMNRRNDLHLESYAMLTPSENEKLKARLDKAVAEKDRKERVLVHSGICSIESAIRAYVKKYAKAKKIKDFVDVFEEYLHQAYENTKASIAALSGGKEAEEIHERSVAVQKMIEKGEEAKRFKEEIDAINPISKIKEEAEKLKDKVAIALIKRFKGVDDKIEGRSQVLHFVNAFSDDAAEAISDLRANLEVLVQEELKNTGEELINAYRAKLEGFDKSVGASLSFSTSDLVAGVLSRINDTAMNYKSGMKSTENEKVIDDIHEDEVEEESIDVVKVKQVTRTIQDGVDKIKKGEERVVVGSHREKVGTRQVRDRRSGFLAGIADFFCPKYRDEDVYETFEDVEYRPTYDYVPKMREIIEDIPTVEQETRAKTHYMVDMEELRRNLITPIKMDIDRNIDKNIEDMLKAAQVWIDDLKDGFIKTFDEIDEIIRDKYAELEELSRRKDELDARLEAKKKIYFSTLDFIDDNIKEIEGILDV